MRHVAAVAVAAPGPVRRSRAGGGASGASNGDGPAADDLDAALPSGLGRRGEADTPVWELDVK